LFNGVGFSFIPLVNHSRSLLTMKALLFSAIAFSSVTLAAEAPRVLTAGTLPDDVRLQPLKDLDGYFPWTPPDNAAVWKVRAEQLRTQLRVALGIFPEPTKTPLNAVIHGKVERDGFTVERVYFESMPGFFVTGSLFRPTSPGPHPGVLCPHGHWNDGRFFRETEAKVKGQIQKGEEALLANGSAPLQARCVELARMGCVVFHYDMIGYADSGQFSQQLAHKFAKQRPEANSADNWGLFSPQAEEHAQSIMGLQAWDSIRALDFITSLPDVDPTKIACTGASGGGTQTFILAALDPRVAVAFPAVMVSTAMQGGCTCENASLLRVGTGNIEIAALFAPKPMGMTAADDWTKEMETKGFPDLAAHWASMGKRENVKLFPHLTFPHNYNLHSREDMYGWLNQHFMLGRKEIYEAEFKPLSREELTVWDSQHPAPAGGLDFEKKLCRWWADDAAKQLAAGGEKITRPALEAIFRRTLSEERAAMNRKTLKKEDRGDYTLLRAVVENDARHEAVPAVFFHPKKWNGRTAIWLTSKGKAGLFNGSEPSDDAARLLSAGWSVMGIDLLMQGEFLNDGENDTPTRKVKNPREAAAFTFGYNDSLFVQRTHDVLSALAFVRDHAEHKTEQVALIALDETAPIAAAARLLSEDFVNSTVLDTHGFRFAAVDTLQSPYFQPAIAKYGDLPEVLRLGHGAVFAKGEQAAGAEPIDWLLTR
jgi:dienelactone hydrolase